MKHDFEKLLKERGKPLNAESAKVMKDSLHGLNEMIKDGLGKDMAGLKKVTVASNSAEGLKEGLDAAKEKVEEKSDKQEESPKHEESESLKHEASESPSEENVEEKVAEDMSAMSEEEKIAFLEKQLEELKAKKKGSELASAKDSIKSIF
jgi:hypothetical protein